MARVGFTREAPQIDHGKHTKKSYYDKVRRESKLADEKNLPSTISAAPRPPKARNRGYLCDCGEVYWFNKDTYMFACGKCDSLKKTSDLETVEEVQAKLEVGVTKYKDIIIKPGPFTKDPARDKEKGKWV